MVQPPRRAVVAFSFVLSGLGCNRNEDLCESLEVGMSHAEVEAALDSAGSCYPQPTNCTYLFSPCNAENGDFDQCSASRRGRPVTTPSRTRRRRRPRRDRQAVAGLNARFSRARV